MTGAFGAGVEAAFCAAAAAFIPDAEGAGGGGVTASRV
jgi:hypothetical protein